MIINLQKKVRVANKEKEKNINPLPGNYTSPQKPIATNQELVLTPIKKISDWTRVKSIKTQKSASFSVKYENDVGQSKKKNSKKSQKN